MADSDTSQPTELGAAIQEFAYLSGKAQAIFSAGLDTWVAHDAGLIHLSASLAGSDRTAHRWTSDIILWHDVQTSRYPAR